MQMGHQLENSLHHSRGGRCKEDGGREVPIKELGRGQRGVPSNRVQSSSPSCLPAPCLLLKRNRDTKLCEWSVEKEILSTLSQQHNPSISGTSNRPTENKRLCTGFLHFPCTQIIREETSNARASQSSSFQILIEADTLQGNFSNKQPGMDKKQMLCANTNNSHSILLCIDMF